jgi:hypothetical protein
LENEVNTAVEETANYTEGRVYAPERHRDLHQRINNLWDLTNLTPRENEWLGAAAGTLNELAVRHAEEAKARGDDDEVIRAAAGLGEWAFRLSNDQEERLIAAVEAVAPPIGGLP